MERTLELFRLGAVVILVVGLIGVLAELFLLKHTDGFWQLIPISLSVLSLLVLSWFGLSRGRLALRVHQGVMILFLVAGVVGAVQHFLGNVTYEQESDPSVSGMELYQRAVMGADPALAPGAMIQLGLIGLLFAFRHPVLVAGRRNENSPLGGTDA